MPSCSLNESIDAGVMEAFKIAISEGKRSRLCPPPHLEKGMALPINFLLWAKLDVDKAAKRYEAYWSTRLELFGEADLESQEFASSIEAELRTGAIELPDARANGRQVLLVRMRKMDYTVMTPESVRSLFWFVLHQAYLSEETIQNGVIGMNDMNDLDKGKNIRLATAKYLGSSIGNILPVRIAGIKIVRQPWFFSAVFTVLSPFLPTKLVSRVEFLGGDLEALKETFPASSIPQELGGTLDHDHVAWLDGLLKEQ